MKKPVYVVDTSYLVEYYKVDGHYKENSHQQIWQRFDLAIKNQNTLYIPVPIIFELANHIAHIKDGNNRQQLAERFVSDIQNSLTKDSPFNLVPCQDFQSIEELAKNLVEFSNCYAKQGLGLTDTAVYLQAEQLFHSYKRLKNYSVHIWTRDKALKALEPDSEQNPFV